MNDGWACATTSGSRHRAELAKITLEAAGIEVHLSIDDASGMAPHLALFSGGAKVMVRTEDLPRAGEILNDLWEEVPAVKVSEEEASARSCGFLARFRKWMLGR